MNSEVNCVTIASRVGELPLTSLFSLLAFHVEFGILTKLQLRSSLLILVLTPFRSNLKRCSGCKVFHYCGQSCQMMDWKAAHKGRECKIYAVANSGTAAGESDLLKIQSAQFLLRVYLTLGMNPALSDREFMMPDGSFRSFRNLMTHMNELLADEMRMRCFQSTVRLFKPLVPDLDVELLLVFYAKICINSFSILNLSLNAIGSGMYIEASVFNHSCRPNATTVWNGLRLEVRAIKDIAAGKEITTNYVDIKKNRSERQTELREHYYFTCACDRCEDQREDDVWPLISQLNERMDDLICQKSGDGEEKFKEIYLCAIRSLPLYEQIYGEFHPDLTIQLMRAVKARANMKQVPAEYLSGNPADSILFLIQKLRRCLQVTHSENHPIFREFQSFFQ